MVTTDNAVNTVYAYFRLGVIIVFVAEPETGLCVTVTPVTYTDPWGLCRHAARAYMEKYYDNSNPIYPLWDLNCANFVSQALVAGGLEPVVFEWFITRPINTGRLGRLGDFSLNLQAAIERSKGRNIYYNDALSNQKVFVSDTWNNANAQYNYFKKFQCYINGEVLEINKDNMAQILKDNNIQMGDLLYWSRDGGNSMFHATIISMVTGDGIYYAGNTSSRFDHPLIDAIGNQTVYIIRLNDLLFSDCQCQ